MQTLKAKSVVDDRFEILELLGAGGMGMVYKARQLEMDREVALKFLQPHLGSDTETLARFTREAAILSSLNHQNILHFYCFGVWHGRAPYIVMEFVNAPELSSVLATEEGQLSWRRTLSIALQICQGLAHAHKHGIVHRDLKPSNVFLISENGTERAKVSDFGLAKVIDGGEKQKLTATGYTLGTPHYMSPEQAEGRQVDATSDVYALGCVMYECLFGRPPFDADTVGGVLFQKVHGELSLPDSAQSKGLPSDLVDVLKTALAKDSTKRYQSMDEMAAAISNVLRGAGSLRDCKAKFYGGTADLESIGARKQLQLPTMAIGLITLSLVVAGSLLWFGLNKEGLKASQSDSALQAARNDDDHFRAVQIELEQLKQYKESDLRQTVYRNFARDLELALRSDRYTSLSYTARQKFILSVCYAMADMDPKLLTRTDVEVFERVGRSVAVTTANDPVCRFYNTAVMSLWKGHERNEKAFLSRTFAPAADLTMQPFDAPYMAEERQLFCKALDLQKLGLSDDQADTLAKQACEKLNTGEVEAAVRTALPIYLSYCLVAPNNRVAKALDKFDAALSAQTADARDSFSVDVLYNLGRVLELYHSRIGDDAALAFYKRAIENASRSRIPENVALVKANWCARYAEALVSRGDNVGAAEQYRAAPQLLSVLPPEHVDQVRCYELEEANLLSLSGDPAAKKRAKSLYEHVIATDPGNGTGLWLHTAYAKSSLNVSKPAALSIDKLLKWTEIMLERKKSEHSSQVDVYKVARANALYYAGREAEAEQLFLSVLESPSGKPERGIARDVLRTLSFYALCKGSPADRAKAAQYATRALKVDAGIANDESIDRALVAMSQQDYDAADCQMRRALSYGGESHLRNYPQYLTFLAKLRVLTGDVPEAKRIMRLAMYNWDNYLRVSPMDVVLPDYVQAKALAAAVGAESGKR